VTPKPKSSEGAALTHVATAPPARVGSRRVPVARRRQRTPAINGTGDIYVSIALVTRCSVASPLPELLAESQCSQPQRCQL